MAAITQDECRRFKLFHILETAGQRVLTYTLQCGMPGGLPSTVTLLQYLDNLPDNSTANYTRVGKSKYFNKTDKDQIERDPACTTFDVTLLYKAIQVACENVAHPNKMEKVVEPNGKVNNVNVWTSEKPLPGYELEHYTCKIKKTRNDVVHEGQPLDEAAFLNEVKTLRVLFDNCLSATKERYARDDAEYRGERATVQVRVTDIQQETLGVAETLQRSAASMLPNFKKETDQELRARLESARYLTPLHFLSGIPEDRVEVSDIFCDITLAEEKGTTPWGDGHKVPYLEVLRLCEGATASTSAGAGPLEQTRPQVLVVEGEAGSGKTTWACFLAQQWLTPQDLRRVQGLDRYELLLRVVCRERSSPTLKGFVQQLLPESYLRYKRFLLPLLKKCRVLIIIDGIDEMNDVSCPLVANILIEAEATAFTVVCTSRPHSVQDLKAEVRRMHFQVSHVRMLGVSSDTQRMELVVRHYQWLSAGANTSANTAALRQAVRGIVWREVFRLPLNLLFLATVFFFEPHRVSSSLSQSDLYQHIHTWCTKKLLARLEAPSQAGQARRSHQALLDRVLLIIHEVALFGLLQDRICLNAQDLQDVKDACTSTWEKHLDTCTTERLDPDAVLSAFYSMRREVTAGEVRETYMAPHKSLQEFMAAKCIAGQVMQYSKGAIERVLRGYIGRQNLPLRKLQQTLVHLVSLLKGQGDVIKEAVHMLQQSGVTLTSEWLDLLTDAVAPDTVVQQAAEQLVSGGLHNDEEIEVSEENMHVASVMLQHLPRQKVEVWLKQEVAVVDNLARVLARHEVTELHLEHHWRHPHQHAASATLLRGAQGSDLRWFRGHLDDADLELLPWGLKHLDLVVRDSRHAQTLLPALAEARRSLPHLRIINLHIPVATVTVIPAALTCWPAHPLLVLYLSGVTDLLVEAAVDIMAGVCPPRPGFSCLYFPEATLDLRGWENLFSRLQKAGVTVGFNVCVPDTHVTQDEAKQLSTLANTMLGCGRVSRYSNEDMWDY